jgi:hypothetical protein
MPQPLGPIEVEPGNPTCGLCDVTMRLYGIESHPTLDRADLWTYVCRRCDEVQTAAVSSVPKSRPGAAFDPEATRRIAATFDAIWEAALASDSLAADTQHRASAREMLARCIIEIIQQGEADPDRVARTSFA